METSSTPASPQSNVAKDVIEQQKESHRWLVNNFYDQWIEAYRAYKCEREPETKPNDETKTKIDLEQTSIGMPDTWSFVRRQVARGTAQPPNLRFRAKDRDLAERISLKCMYDWDRGGVQRLQKKHFLQTCLFGWSVRAWSWDCLEYQRNRRVDPIGDALDGNTMAELQSQYSDDIQRIKSDYASKNSGAEADPQLVMAELVAARGRGRMLPMQYTYRKYEGPKADFLFVGDCFPEPKFADIQSSRGFIVRRARRLSWFKRLIELYPQLKAGVRSLMDKAPNGHPQNGRALQDDKDLRNSLLTVAGQSDLVTDIKDAGEKTWNIYERHVPGGDAKVAYVSEDQVFIGEIPYPYDLDGKIAFTELVLIDDLLSGVGDAHARVLRGLQQLHDRQVNVRFDLIYNILRPLIGTSNQELYDNPELLRRGPGFRLVKAFGQGDLWVIGEQAAIAAAAAGLQDESAIQRLIQQATGENNMTMAAGVDPQQGRTATGARLMAFNQDILSQDMNAMFTFSLNSDAEMIYLLNRSEMPDKIEFNAAQYKRNYEEMASEKPESDKYITVTPQDFQIDGEIEAIAGSTLADDDDAKVQQANNLFAAATANPQYFNIEKARDKFLIANGVGRELAEWMPKPLPPPEPEKPKMSISVKFETLAPEIQQKLLEQQGVSLAVEPPPMDEPPGPPPPIPFVPPPPGAGPMPAASQPVSYGALAAAEGRRAA